MKRKPTLSLIFPIYNESQRLQVSFTRALKFLSRQRYRSEIILVDDGSSPPVVHRWASYPVKLVALSRNIGKGGAIAAGVAHASGRYIVFSDIDLSVSLDHLSSMLGLLRTHPVVIGSRRLPASRIVTHQPRLRELTGRVFTFLSNVICGIHVADATCGFKGYQTNAAKRLFSRMTIQRWVFDVEILYLARKFGYDISEMPVIWADCKGTKVRGSDIVGSFIDLLRIRWNDRKGVCRLSVHLIM